MTVEEMKDRKRELGYSNRELAELSGVPLGTLQKIFSGATAAPRRAAVEALTRVLQREPSLREDGADMPRGMRIKERMGEAKMDPTGQPGDPAGVPDAGILRKADAYPAGKPDDWILREAEAIYEVDRPGQEILRRKRQGEYTLEDYRALPDERRVELIDGVIYDMAAPGNIHQAISQQIAFRLGGHVDDKKGTCMVYTAPFDVQLDEDNRTMVQPDVVVICRQDRLRRFGCFGAPDLVMEILSPSTAQKDLLIKLQKYIRAGVREYWVINPKEKQVTVYRNGEEGLQLRSYSFSEKVPVGIWEDGYSVDFGEIYERIGFLYELEE